jgi:hypothetical protein
LKNSPKIKGNRMPRASGWAPYAEVTSHGITGGTIPLVINSLKITDLYKKKKYANLDIDLTLDLGWI